jgi:hypothetical protein
MPPRRPILRLDRPVAPHAASRASSRAGWPLRRCAWPTAGLAAVALAAADCGATDFINEMAEPTLDIARMEDDIRWELQRNLEGRARSTRGSVASVGQVRCRQRTELTATCRARVARPSGRQLWRLTVSVNPDTGRYRWEIAG